MRDLPPELVARGNSFTFQSLLCLRCARSYDCVSGSRVPLSKSDYILSINGKLPRNKAMEEGALLHAEYATGIPTPAEVGGEGYQRRLRTGEEVVMQEVKSCAMVRGQRGALDIMRIKRAVTSLGTEYLVTIQDNKRSRARETFSKGMVQLAQYAMIYHTPTRAYIHATEKEWFPIYLPEDTDPIITVRAFLHFFNGGGGDYPTLSSPGAYFAVRNKITDWWMRYVFQVYRLLPQKRRLNRRGTYMINMDLDDHQSFFGKRKLLVKAPPADWHRSNLKR